VQQEQADYDSDIMIDSFDIDISQETTEQIAQLVIACKEFQLKVT
jgi:hypothetical protein